MKARPRTKAKTMGVRLMMFSLKSMLPAVAPVTRASAEPSSKAAGIKSSRSSFTASIARSSPASPLTGMNSSAVSPASLNSGSRATAPYRASGLPSETRSSPTRLSSSAVELRISCAKTFCFSPASTTTMAGWISPSVKLSSSAMSAFLASASSEKLLGPLKPRFRVTVGAAIAIKTAMTTTAGMIGRASTRSTMKPHTPSPLSWPRPRNGMLSRFRLSPIMAMIAGRSVMALITAMTTTTMEARPRLLKIASFTRNMPATANTVVAPAKKIALPEVPVATCSASSLERPALRSLR